MRTPSSATLLLSTYLRRSVRSAMPYRQTNLELPPASIADPSAEKERERKHLVAFAFLDETLESAERPPAASARPSIVPTCAASAASHKAIFPSRVETASMAPSGEKASASTSAPCCNDSIEELEETKSHNLTVLSHEPDARTHAEPPELAPKARHDTGASCPASVSSRCAVCRFHTYTL
eukprot:scaffold314064_cov32-Tisochrysis_lutea.AAC.3